MISRCPTHLTRVAVASRTYRLPPNSSHSLLSYWSSFVYKCCRVVLFAYFRYETPSSLLTMTQSEVPQEEYDQTSGPGAPIPLSQLVVSYEKVFRCLYCDWHSEGYLWSDRKRYQTGTGGWLSHRWVNRIHVCIHPHAHRLNELSSNHAPRPKRALEQIKGISEAKAGKLLNEGELSSLRGSLCIC